MSKPLVDIDAQLATMDADERLGLHDLPRLTSQQKVFVAARVSGLNITAASREAGCSVNTGQKWDKDALIQQYRARYEAEMERESLPRVRFGIEDAHAMYMQAYKMAGTSAEMTKATDSLVKLHRLNDAPPVAEVPKTVSARQLADMPVSELMRLAGMKLDSLSPGVIEGEYEEVEE